MKIKILAAAMAALFMLPMLSLTALAAPDDMPDDVAAIIAEAEEAPPADTDPAPVTGGYDPEAPTKPTATPFTPAGTGTVVDHATDEDGKEFYTIMTPAENVFYLVIDRQRSTENVYFLNAVTEADLLSLAEIPVTTDPLPATTPEQTTVTAPVEPEAPPAPEPSGSNMGMVILIVAVVIVGGGAGWYFKVYRPKQQKVDTEDDYDYSADDSDYEDDGLPPWDDADAEDENV